MAMTKMTVVKLDNVEVHNEKSFDVFNALTIVALTFGISFTFVADVTDGDDAMVFRTTKKNLLSYIDEVVHFNTAITPTYSNFLVKIADAFGTEVDGDMSLSYSKTENVTIF